MSTLMDPPFLTFSAEVLIEILAHLPLRDIVACKLTCRKLCDVIARSSLLQYIIQSFLAGVYDPLLSGAPIVERLNALKDLEATWRDLDVRQRTTLITRGNAWPWLNYTVQDDYLLALRSDSDSLSQPPGYSYIDLRQPAALTDPVWRKVDVPWPGQHYIFSFAANENDLAVVVTCARDEDISRVEIHCLSFVSGEPHPLAENPDLVVDLPGSSSSQHIQAQIMGDHVLLSCNGSPPNEESQVDVLFLVNWKEGKVTSLRETPSPAMTFAVGFTWISETLIAFVHMAANAIVLYEFVEEPGQLNLIKTLGLPPLCDGGRLNFARCLSEQNPLLHRASHPNSRPPPRCPFTYNPADAVACFILGVGLEEIPDASMTIAIVVHRRALVALASSGAAAAVTDVGANNERPIPWDDWGPPVTRCFEVPYWHRCSGPVGQRWGMLAHDELVLRDFNPHSVRHTAGRLETRAPGMPAGASSSSSVLRHENGNRTRVVTAPTRLTAGLCFRGDVISHLPYVETRAMCTPRWESVITDGERLLGLYFKEDDADAHKVDINVFLMGVP